MLSALPLLLGLDLVSVQTTVLGVSARALEQFAVRAQLAVGIGGEVDVLITSSAKMRRLNRQFRCMNAPTDVLSFPSENGDGGDIAISAQIATRNARRLGHSATHEFRILILHGLLHLAGYDHETDAGEMARREARLRRKLGLPMALIERAAADGNIHHRGTETRNNSLSKSSVSPCLRGEFVDKGRRS